LDLIYRHVPVFQAHCQFLRFVATANSVHNILRDFFDLYIPEPGKIFTVDEGMARGQQQMFLAWMLGYQAQHKVE
jgi:hypothetical protein